MEHQEDMEANRRLQLTGDPHRLSMDPPFDVGADFSMDIEIGGDTFTKKPNILEEIAYRDTWGQGADSFILEEIAYRDTWGQGADSFIAINSHD